MKYVKRILKISGGLLLIAMVSLFIYAHTIRFRMSDEEFHEALENDQTSVDIRYFDHDKGTVRAIWVDKDHDDLMILLHGSPSSSAQWVPMVNDSLLSQKVDFLLIDRPGYGYSSFGNPVLSVADVSKIIKEISDTYRGDYRQVYVLGTSYGGTVAARLLMDYPGYFKAGMLVSSSLAPGEEYTYPISYVMDQVPWFFPKFLMVANDEKLNHKEQLAAMQPLWGNIQDPLFFMHSTTDDLVYPANVDFALDRLSAELPVEVLWVPNAQHSMFWSDRELFLNNVNAFLDGNISFRPLSQLKEAISVSSPVSGSK